MNAKVMQENKNNQSGVVCQISPFNFKKIFPARGYFLFWISSIISDLNLNGGFTLLLRFFLAKKKEIGFDVYPE